jgi:hypothetical protein
MARLKKGKTAVFGSFLGALLLSDCTFRVDNGSRERKALTAFRLAPHRRISAVRAVRAALNRCTQITFLDGIAHTNDHNRPRYCKSLLVEPRMIRNSELEN